MCWELLIKKKVNHQWSLTESSWDLSELSGSSEDFLELEISSVLLTFEDEQAGLAPLLETLTQEVWGGT